MSVVLLTLIAFESSLKALFELSFKRCCINEVSIIIKVMSV